MRKKLSWLLIASLTLTLLTPIGAMAADNGANGTATATTVTATPTTIYEATKKKAAMQADVLTATYGATSVQYALIDNGKIVLSGHSGVNSITENKVLTAETMYGIGSTSKMFAATAVMKLVDEGKIDLDKSLTTYIPDFKMADERYKQITPRMLLNHSSGLGGSTLGSTFLFNDNDTYSHDTLLTNLSTQRLKADPGAFSVYCNDGFTLAEILVERVSGMDFTSYIHTYITQPLGMSNTKTPQDEMNDSQLAGLYVPGSPAQLPKETVNILGSGGIYSTAEDLARFAQIFMDQTKVLSPQAVKAMAQPEYKRGMWPEEGNTSFNYGLGWDSVSLYPFDEYGIQALTKGGDTLFSHSSLVVLPEYKMAAIVMSSGGASTFDQLLANEMLLSVLQEKGVIKERKPAKTFGVPVKAEMPKELLKHAGVYGALQQLLKIELTADGNMTLGSVMMPSMPAQTFTYTADGSFIDAGGSVKLRFVTEDNGRTYLWAQSYADIAQLGQVANTEYMAEKLGANPLDKLDKDVAAAWAEREGKRFFLMNEKYTSQMYIQGMPVSYVATFQDIPGYLGTNKIISANEARNELQIPTMAGRDTMDYRFFMEDGIEYLQAGNSLYAEQEIVKPLYAGKQSTASIQAEGHARWFMVPEQAEGKTMTVELPEAGAFAVYDGMTGRCVNYTVVSGVNTVVLPKNGSIVFAGEVGSQFKITLK